MNVLTSLSKKILQQEVSIEKIDITPYQLKTRSFFPFRKTFEGHLLRVCFSGVGAGYADCFPWVELGDLPFTAQCQMLQQGRPSSLLRRSLVYAWIDAQARREQRSLFEGCTIPPSHALLFHEASSSEIEDLVGQGFQSFKMKMGPESMIWQKRWILRMSTLFRKYHLKLRLDMNHRFTEQQFDDFCESLKHYEDLIDFIEDPFPFHEQRWRFLQQNRGFRLACDRLSESVLETLEPGCFSVLVLKPAVSDPEQYLPWIQRLGVSLVVTSYLDHPLGQLSAAWTAAQLYSKFQSCGHSDFFLEAGLLSHTVYEPHAFSKWMHVQGPRLMPELDSIGWGMTPLLESLPWKPLEFG